MKTFPGLLAALAVCASFALAPAAASADTASTLTVVGTSDVSDSGLVPNLIMPEFQAAFPQFHFSYVGSATLAAIKSAETGSGGASVLIVHAASLENQFVASGFSLEPYGRAIFRNDFVLAGPSSDPAGVKVDGTHNVVQAFADIAAAGINGGGTPKVTFYSRSGGPGTTVEEHAIWQQVGQLPNRPAGLALCTVGTNNGGGEAPIVPNVVADGATCPGGTAATATSPTGANIPSWYLSQNLGQGPNVVATNACTSGQSGANSCYVLTDRGTFDYLTSGTDPGITGIPNLSILSSDNDASAPGGADELINYFHAYIVNPAAPNETVNVPAAQDFLNFLTSPSLQSQLASYLPVTAGDPGGPPFVADASPFLTASGIPSSIAAGTPITVSGNLTNAEPGYPALAGQPVTIDEIVGGLPVPVAGGNTDANGHYSIQFSARSSGAYQASTGQISQIENASLNPVFGDLLSPAATTPVTMTVQSPPAATPTPTPLPLPVTPPLPGAPPGLPSSSVSLKTLTIKNGALTATGVVGPAPTASSGARVELFAVREQKLATSKPKPKRTAKAASTAFKVIAVTSVATGKTTYTIKAKLTRGYRWALQVGYLDPGHTASFSKAVGTNVH